MSGSNRAAVLVLLAAVVVLPMSLGDGYALQVVNIALINAVVVIGLNFVTGYTGQVNFGQAAFYGIGAYATAIAAKAGVPWIATPFIAALLAAVASLGLGLPTLRLRTFYLAMATIGFGEIVRACAAALGAGDRRLVGAARHPGHQPRSVRAGRARAALLPADRVARLCNDRRVVRPRLAARSRHDRDA